MKPLHWSVVSALLAPLALEACSSDAGRHDDDSAAAGALQLAVAAVPADVRCLRVAIDGSRDVVNKLELEPGKAASFVLDRLPIGLANVDAQAFARACRDVSSDAVATFTLERPVTVDIRAAGVTRVKLELVRNGRIGIDVSFEGAPTGEPVKLAVIGDTPYGADELAGFPGLVSAINAAHVGRVVHVGDIKNGSTRCDTSYYQTIASDFAAFQAPLVYTPGDNEWTDCHRANNGAYDPLERLSVIRQTFFPKPGVTLGAPAPVLSQASIPAYATFVENQLWVDASVVFSTVHVVGSDNGLAPWFGTDTTGTKVDDPARRTAEVEARIAAALDWIARSFDVAESSGARGIALFMQADTFQGSTTGFYEIIRSIAERARRFTKPVLLVQGDSHRFTVDQPFAAGNALYGITEPVSNLTRIVVEGETIGEWLELTVGAEPAQPFSWRRIPYAADDAGAPDAGAASGLRINEVLSNPNPDWIEFVNTGAAALDASGFTFSDDDPTHVYTFPAGTIVPAGGLLLLSGASDFSFGLGSADSAVLRDPSGAIVDQYSWTAHVSSAGRCPQGTGPFTAMAPTPGAVNACP